VSHLFRTSESKTGEPTIVPRFGYLCAAWDPPSWSGDPERIGTTEVISTVDFVNRSGLQNFANFGGYSTLTATFCEGGTLFGANAGPGVSQRYLKIKRSGSERRTRFCEETLITIVAAATPVSHVF
jgi:hypothetical protein